MQGAAGSLFYRCDAVSGVLNDFYFQCEFLQAHRFLPPATYLQNLFNTTSRPVRIAVSIPRGAIQSRGSSRLTDCSFGGLHPDVRLHRVGNEALLVGGVVHLVLFFGCRCFRSGIGNSGMKDDRTHPKVSVFVLGHQPHRFILVARDFKAFS